MGVVGNIGDRDAIAAMKEEIDTKFGDVDILVNCAGGDIGASGNKPVPNDLLGIPYEDIVALTTNNLIGTMLMCQAFVNPMRERGHGVVVNVGSTAAHVGVPNGSVYAVLKAGVVHFTRCLAAEVMHDGVRVNCVSPGPSKTARFQATRVLDPQKMDASGKSFRSLCRARGNRRRRGVPVQPAGQIHPRPGAARRWRQPAVHQLIAARRIGDPAAGAPFPETSPPDIFALSGRATLPMAPFEHGPIASPHGHPLPASASNRMKSLDLPN